MRFGLFHNLYNQRWYHPWPSHRVDDIKDLSNNMGGIEADYWPSAQWVVVKLN